MPGLTRTPRRMTLPTVQESALTGQDAQLSAKDYSTEIHLSDANRAVRELIQNPRKSKFLLKKRENWLMLCSSMDVVDDTCLAISAYRSSPPASSDGERYLGIYGVLQVLFVQQDAVRHMATALNMTSDENLVLAEIREIRNNAIGHPTRRDPIKKKRLAARFNFLVRSHLGTGQFTIHTTWGDGTPTLYQTHNTFDLIDSQQNILTKYIYTIIDKLQAEIQEYKMQRKSNPLRECLPPFVDYNIKCLFDVLHGTKPTTFAAVSAQEIEKALDCVNGTLEKRGDAEVFEGIDYIIKEIRHAIFRLKMHYADPVQSYFSDQDVNVFIEYINFKLQEMREVCEDVDSDE